jgi:hypothetical protein
MGQFLSCLGLIFTVGIPLSSLLFRIVVSLTGGFRIPLAWAFSYYAALSVAFIFSFVFAETEIRWRHTIKLTRFAVFLSIFLGSALGAGFSQAGVLGNHFADTSQGNVSFWDSLLCAKGLCWCFFNI